MAIMASRSSGWIKSRQPSASTSFNVRPVYDTHAELTKSTVLSGRSVHTMPEFQALMRRAQMHAASLLGRHALLERFGQVAVRTLVRAGAKRTEIASTRRLFTSLQQGLLEARD